MKKILENTLALGFGCLVGILLMEGVLRIYNPISPRVKGNRIVLPANKRYVLKNKDIPGIPEKIVHTKNNLGFRGPDKPAADFDSTLSIVAVGGSTTECLYLPDGYDWPALLGDSLKPYFKRLWINNAGLDGHSSFGHLVLLKDYIVKLRPKTVLFLMGRNDVGNMGDTGFEASHVKGPLLFSSAEALLKSFSAHSELVATALNLYRVLRARSQGLPHQSVNWSTLEARSFPEPELEGTLRLHAEKFIPQYEKRLHRLVTICRENSIFPVFITQSAMFGPGTDPVSHRDLAAVRVEGWSGYAQWKILEQYNDVTRRIGQEMQVPVIDLASLMPKNSAYYYDFFHYTEAGSREVATLIFSRLLPLLL